MVRRLTTVRTSTGARDGEAATGARAGSFPDESAVPNSAPAPKSAAAANREASGRDTVAPVGLGGELPLRISVARQTPGQGLAKDPENHPDPRLCSFFAHHPARFRHASPLGAARRVDT